jgi:hypothetical protein
MPAEVTVQVRVADLQGAEANPRKWTDEDRRRVRESMERHSVVEPIVGGHLRASVAAEMGIEELPAVVVEVGQREERLMLLRLNRTAEWDYARLGAFSGDELAATGFDREEIERAASGDEAPKGEEAEWDGPAGFRIELEFSDKEKYDEARERSVGADRFERTANLIAYYGARKDKK